MPLTLPLACILLLLAARAAMPSHCPCSARLDSLLPSRAEPSEPGRTTFPIEIAADQSVSPDRLVCHDCFLRLFRANQLSILFSGGVLLTGYIQPGGRPIDRLSELRGTRAGALQLKIARNKTVTIWKTGPFTDELLTSLSTAERGSLYFVSNRPLPPPLSSTALYKPDRRETVEEHAPAHPAPSPVPSDPTTPVAADYTFDKISTTAHGAPGVTSAKDDKDAAVVAANCATSNRRAMTALSVSPDSTASHAEPPSAPPRKRLPVLLFSIGLSVALLVLSYFAVQYCVRRFSLSGKAAPLSLRR